jgi:hypothetical protein
MLDNHAKYLPEKLSHHAKGQYGYEPVGQLLNTIYRKDRNKN